MNDNERTRRHLRITEPSAWVRRFAPLIPPGGAVLDLACGGGRHASLLLDLGYEVVATDRDTAAVRERLGGREGLTIVDIDLEDAGPPFEPPSPLAGRPFTGAVVVNYLYRPLFSPLIGALRPGGVFIYETFGRGNEAFGKPRNPDHLLEAGELLTACRDLRVVAYECGLDKTGELPGVKQRICAINTTANAEPPELPESVR